MDITSHIKELTGLSIRGVAEKSGLEQSKLNKQLRGDTTLTMETLRDVARGNNLDMLTLFVLAKKITPQESETLRATGSLSRVSDEALADEILKRMQGGNSMFEEDSPFQSEHDLAANRSTAQKGEPDPFE